MNLMEFAALNRERARSMKTQTSAKATKIVMAMITRLAVDTPKDTGRATSNWVVSVGTPGNRNGPPFVPGYGGFTGDANIQAVLRAARAALRTKKVGGTLWISNDTHYIGKLNRGSSAQHPGGFVQDAVTLGNYMARQK